MSQVNLECNPDIKTRYYQSLESEIPEIKPKEPQKLGRDQFRYIKQNASDIHSQLNKISQVFDKHLIYIQREYKQVYFKDVKCSGQIFLRQHINNYGFVIHAISTIQDLNRLKITIHVFKKTIDVPSILIKGALFTKYCNIRCRENLK